MFLSVRELITQTKEMTMQLKEYAIGGYDVLMTDSDALKWNAGDHRHIIGLVSNPVGEGFLKLDLLRESHVIYSEMKLDECDEIVDDTSMFGANKVAIMQNHYADSNLWRDAKAKIQQ